nr:potassium channel family protein [Escherichia albertii]
MFLVFPLQYGIFSVFGDLSIWLLFFRCMFYGFGRKLALIICSPGVQCARYVLLRILRLLRFMPALNSLWVAIYNARHQLILFYSFIAIVLIVAGTLMYAVEGATNGFNSLGTSVYWAIVTVTTVGYGDITPHTDAGRIVASMLILIGYSVIAIPTGIIAAQLTSELEQTKKQRRCSKCNTQHHALDARYCRICGNSLMTEK